MKKLFSIEEDGDVVLQDNTFLLIPELRTVYKELGGDYIRYIVLSCDYHSPYRDMAKDEKIKEVCLDIWQKEPKEVKNLNSQLILNAKDKYKKLQYDPIREQYIVYTEKLAEYNKLIKGVKISEDNADPLQKIMIGQEKVVEARDKIAARIIKQEAEEQIRGEGSVSVLEELIEKQ